jgi:RimJ/RimL family protein N-acetyltransferase
MEVIETERLILRPFTLDDVEPSYQMNLDPEVSRYTHDGGVHTKEEILEMIRDHTMKDYEDHGYGRHAVEWKETGEFIGFSGLKYLPEYDEVDLGYRLRTDYWGRGIATESGKAALDWGFQTLDLKSIIAIALKENKASFRVMEKLGMHFDKEMEVDALTAIQYRINR